MVGAPKEFSEKLSTSEDEGVSSHSQSKQKIMLRRNSSAGTAEQQARQAQAQ